MTFTICKNSLNGLNSIKSRDNFHAFENSKKNLNNIFTDSEIDDTDIRNNLNDYSSEIRENVPNKRPKELDDTVNYKSKESFQFGSNYISNKNNANVKLRNKSTFNWSTDQRKSQAKSPGNLESNKSIGINGSLNEIDHTPTLQVNSSDNQMERAFKNINCNTCDSNGRYVDFQSTMQHKDANNISYWSELFNTGNI